MEVFAVPTPTSSGNYKPNLESFLPVCVATRPKKLYALERDADLLPCGEIAVDEAIDLDDFSN